MEWQFLEIPSWQLSVLPATAVYKNSFWCHPESRLGRVLSTDSVCSISKNSISASHVYRIPSLIWIDLMMADFSEIVIYHVPHNADTRDAFNVAKLLRLAALVNKTRERALAVIVFLWRSRDYETLTCGVFKHPACMCAWRLDGSLSVS